MISIVDEIESSEQQEPNDKSFFEIPYDKEDENSRKVVLEWLKKERDFLLDENSERFNMIKKNLALNKGILYKDQDVRGDRQTVDQKKSVVEKMVINKLKEASRIRASKLLKYKPNVSILPTNDELADKIAAEQTKNLLDHIWYIQRYDGVILPRIVSNKGPMGEMYNRITWNPNAGDIAKQYKDALSEEKKRLEAEGKDTKVVRIPLMGDDGKQKLDDNGKPIFVDKPVRNGDVEYKAKSPLDLLFDKHPSNELESSRWVFEREVMLADEARIAFPKSAKFIKDGNTAQVYDYEKMQLRKIKNAVVVWRFYHKRTDYFDEGRYVVFTDEGILDSTKFPYSHRNLPFIRHIDHENPGEQHGASFFEDCKQIFGAFNNINNMILRNEFLVGHPKWMMPAGAADIRELGNKITVVQYKGPTAPALVQANPTGQGAYNLRNTLKDEGMEAADVARVGNGNAPQGITAAVAMQFLSELEQERWNTSVLYHNESILQTVQMTISVCGDYYDAKDERQIRLQGTDGQWQSAFYDASNLSKDYDVRVQSSSALPETKAARTETLLFAAKNFPGSVDQEQVLDMFDLAQNKKFVKEGTISVRAAEAENEMILKNKDVAAPEEFEDQIKHWNMHVKAMREWSFKNKASQEVKQKMYDHVKAHEMFMANIALKNPQYVTVLASLPGFPFFFKVNEKDGNLDSKAETEAALAEQQMQYEANPMNVPPELETQTADGMEVQPEVPPLDTQLGMEQENVEPTNSI